MLKACAVGALVALSVQPSFAQGFDADISLEELDARKGTIRASDLAVRDAAYFWPSEFCLIGTEVFLPSTEPVAELGEATRIYVRVEMLPGRELKGTLRFPTKPGEFGPEDIEGFLSIMSEPTGLFFNRQASACKDRQEWSRWEMEFYPLVSIDGHKTLSELAADLDARDLPFDAED